MMKRNLLRRSQRENAEVKKKRMGFHGRGIE
jgi:hypothetical protein